MLNTRLKGKNKEGFKCILGQFFISEEFIFQNLLLFIYLFSEYYLFSQKHTLLNGFHSLPSIKAIVQGICLQAQKRPKFKICFYLMSIALEPSGSQKTASGIICKCTIPSLDITLSSYPSYSQLLAFCCFLTLHIMLIGMQDVCTYVCLSACVHACLRDIMACSDGSSSKIMATCESSQDDTLVLNLAA